MAVWPFPPDWDRGVQITYEFLTEIITSYRGNEQRVAQRDAPRMSMEFETVVSGADLRLMLAQLSSAHNEQHQMPDWTSPVLLEYGSASGSTVIRVQTKDEWTVAGSKVILIWIENDATRYLTRTISSISGMNLTLNSPLTATIPDDAVLYALWDGHLDSKITNSFSGDRTSTLKVSFSVDPGFETLPAPPAAESTYRGRELFDLEPDWSSNISQDMMTVLDTLDYGFGRMSFKSSVPFNDRLVSLSFVGEDRAAARAIRDLFRRQYGRQGEFYMPTFTEDLVIRNNTPSGSATIRMIGPEASVNYADSTVYRDIMVLYLDGTYDLHQVTGITSITDSTGADSILTISPATLRLIRPGDVDKVMWVPVWRFGSDQLVLQWVSDQVARIGVTCKTLENLTAET